MRILIYVILVTLIQNVNANQKHDVIIYGGTPSGVITSLNLAQKGYQVLLVEPTDHIGGMYVGGLMTSEIMHMIKGCISGMAQEYYTRLGYNTPEGYFHNFKHGDPAHFFECKGAEKTFLDWLYEYKDNIEIIYGQRVINVKKEQATIKEITFENFKTYTADYFVDCSYEGDLMRYAGVSYFVGREAKETFNEKYAGVRFQKDTLYGTTINENGNRLPYFREINDFKEGDDDDCVAAYNYRCVLTDVENNKVRFYKPTNYDSTTYNPSLDFLLRNPQATIKDFFGIIGRGNGKTGFNTKQDGENTISVGLLGTQCSYPLASYETRDSLRAVYENYTKGLFYFLSYDTRVPEHIRSEMSKYGYAKDEFTDNNHFPYYLYVREARRMIGDFVETEHDILTNRYKNDAITLGSHWIDSHHVQRIAVSDTTFTNEGRIWHKVTKPFELPYRIMLPKEEQASNLLVPVASSISHVAYCAYRLEPTWMQMGHASGTAAALAIKNGCSVADISIDELQYQLRLEGMIFKIDHLGPYDDYSKN